MTREHDLFIESLLGVGSYTKLYSYTHLLNGFAIHAHEEEVYINRIACISSSYDHIPN